jgi:hypothetical protein
MPSRTKIPKKRLGLGLLLISNVCVTSALGCIPFAKAAQNCTSVEIERHVKILEESWWQDEPIQQFIAQCQQSAVPALSKILSAAEASELRRVAVQGLGKVGGPEATEAIVQALKRDQHVYVRSDAATALGELEGAIARDGLLVALTSDPEKIVRRSAAVSLGKQGDSLSVEALIRAVKTEDDSEVQKAAAQSLSNVGEPAIASLAELLQTPDVISQYWALVALTGMDSELAIAAIEAAKIDAAIIFDQAEVNGLVPLDRAPGGLRAQGRDVIVTNSIQIPAKPLICKAAWVKRVWPRCQS